MPSIKIQVKEEQIKHITEYSSDKRREEKRREEKRREEKKRKEKKRKEKKEVKNGF